MAFAVLAPKPSSHPFQERQLSLKEPVKIGRAVAKAKSSQSNGIFDCKVLSRNHAVMWYENGKFLLQDTKSSNGTYVNSVRLSRGSEESEPCQMKSGDTLQFGVEVVENSKNVTHGCIIGVVTLYNEDGTEAVADQEDTPSGLLQLLTSSDQAVLPQELWQLAQFLQDALHREQMLENKLATLQRMIGNCHVASEDTFQGFIQEDRLLSRLETLENQLDIMAKEGAGEDEMTGEMVSYQNERLQYESCAKETLQRILKEKIDALQKCSDLERLLSNSEDEYSYLKGAYEKSQDAFNDVLEKNKEEAVDIQLLKEELQNTRRSNENLEEQYNQNIANIKLLLEEAERRGSGAAVEVESLQAECDFTKKQLQAMKERYEQLQEKFQNANDSPQEDGEMDQSGNDLPFASENATLEKDVKNKSAYIQTLKAQLAAVMSELETQREEVEKLKENTELDNRIYLPNIYLLEELQQKLMNTKDDLVLLSSNVCTDDSIVLASSTWKKNSNDFDDYASLSVKERSDCFSRMLSGCNTLVEFINDDLGTVSTAVSDLFSSNALLLSAGKRDTLMIPQETVCVVDEQVDLATAPLSPFDVSSTDSMNKSSTSSVILRKQSTQTDNLEDRSQHLVDENEGLRTQVRTLQQQYDSLKETYDSAVEEYHRTPSRTESEGGITSTASMSADAIDNDWQSEDLHSQLEMANRSFEELQHRVQLEVDAQQRKQTQLSNLVMTLFVILVMFGALVMLGIVKVSPGSLPSLAEDTTWTWLDVWEQLF